MSFHPIRDGGWLTRLRGLRLGIVMGRRMSQRRALRKIERDLVRSDPHLNALFVELTGLGRDEEMPVTEQIPTGPHWLPARRGRRARSPDG